MKSCAAEALASAPKGALRHVRCCQRQCAARLHPYYTPEEPEPLGSRFKSDISFLEDCRVLEWCA